MSVPALGWTDDEGEPLGDWEEIDCAESIRLYTELGDDRTVFSGSTNPWRSYRAWGNRNENLPAFDDLMEGEQPNRKCTHRRFVVRNADPS